MNSVQPHSSDHFEALRGDHARVLERLAALDAGRLGDSRPPDVVSLRDLATHLERQFATHMAAEERVLFPALRAAFPEGRGTLDPLTADHAEMRQMLVDLCGLLDRSPGAARDEQLLVLARDLSDLLRLHIRKEESVVFDVAERVLSRAELDAMAAGLESFRNPT